MLHYNELRNFDCPELEELLHLNRQFCPLDKLWMTTNQRLNDRFFTVLATSKDVRGCITDMRDQRQWAYRIKHSRRVFNGDGWEFLMTIHALPRYRRACRLKIELNPKRFGTYRLLKRFLGLLIEGFNPSELKLTRIDLSMLFPLPLDFFWRSLFIPRKRKVTKLKHGFYVGAKASGEYFAVYDKAYELNLSGQTMSRIESRLRYKKQPMQTFNRLYRLTQMNPFSRLELVKVLTDDPTFGKRDLVKAGRLLRSVDEVGMIRTIREFSRGRNFSKLYGRIAKDDGGSFSNLCGTVFQESVRAFFDDDGSAPFVKTSCSAKIEEVCDGIFGNRPSVKSEFASVHNTKEF